jgi:hypothetical protein
MLNKLKKWKWAALPMLLMGIAVALFAFKKDDAYSRMTGSPALDMSYQVEQVTVKKYENTSGTCYEGISELSDAQNYSIKFSMSDAGEYEMTIGLQESPQDLSQVGMEEPNITKVRTIRINNSTITNYDANGSVIESRPNQGEVGSLETLKNIAEMSSQQMYDAILNATVTGGTVQGPDGQTAQIKSNKNGLVELASNKATCLFNMDKRVIQALSVLDDAGKVVLDRYIDANREGGAFVLKSIEDISYQDLPNSNAKTTTRTTQKFNNFQIVDYSGKATMGK